MTMRFSPLTSFLLLLPLMISSTQVSDSMISSKCLQGISSSNPGFPVHVLQLRGGQADQEEAYARYQKNIKDLEAAVDKFDKRVTEDFPPEDIIGMSPQGFPMGSVPNPSRCVVYEEPKTVESLEPENWQPNAQVLEEAMKAVDWMESVAKEMSPERMEQMLNERGFKLEDLRPSINSLGTRMGNLTAIEQARAALLEQVEQIRTTHALLRHEMSQVSPVDELKKEIDEIRESGINPYVQLLHDWKKNKEQERESGAFLQQYRAHKKPAATVDPVKGDPLKPAHPIPALAAPPQQEP